MAHPSNIPFRNNAKGGRLAERRRISQSGSASGRSFGALLTVMSIHLVGIYIWIPSEISEAQKIASLVTGFLGSIPLLRAHAIAPRHGLPPFEFYPFFMGVVNYTLTPGPKFATLEVHINDSPQPAYLEHRLAVVRVEDPGAARFNSIVAKFFTCEPLPIDEKRTWHQLLSDSETPDLIRAR